MNKGKIRETQQYGNLSSDTDEIVVPTHDQDSQHSLESAKPVLCITSSTDGIETTTTISNDDGEEYWIWDDYLIKFRKIPKPAADGLNHIIGKLFDAQGITRHYSVTAFYVKNQDLFGIVSNENVAITLVLLSIDVDIDVSDDDFTVVEAPENRRTVMKIISHDESSRENKDLGIYKGSMDQSAVRQALFDNLRRRLNVTGNPSRTGTVDTIHGNRIQLSVEPQKAEV